VNGLLPPCLCAIAFLQQPSGEATPADPHAFVEVVAARATYYVQEPVRVVLRIGFDAGFLRQNGIPLFHQRLDVPLQLHAPWLQDLPGTRILAAAASAPAGQQTRLSLAVNDNRAVALQVEDRTVDGRQFTVLELDQRLLPTRAGELVIPAPWLSYAYASRFDNDLLAGRVPADRHDATVRGAPLTLRIEPLPAAGQPAAFTGAIGRFSVTAEASPRELAVGESLALALRISGDGNLEFCDPPRLPALAGWHQNGMIEQHSATGRTCTFDLVLLSSTVQEVPAIPFAYFDPTPPAGYRTVQTQPIALLVRPLPPGAARPRAASGGGNARPGENDIFGLRPVATLPRPAGATGLWPVLLVLGSSPRGCSHSASHRGSARGRATGAIPRACGHARRSARSRPAPAARTLSWRRRSPGSWPRACAARPRR